MKRREILMGSAAVIAISLSAEDKAWEQLKCAIGEVYKALGQLEAAGVEVKYSGEHTYPFSIRLNRHELSEFELKATLSI